MKLLIVGAGGFAVEVEELAQILGYDEISFLDDSLDKARCKPVIGRISDMALFLPDFDSAIVAMGNNDNRLKYTNQLIKTGYNVISLIHPTAYVSQDVEIGPGCIIRSHAIISRYVKLNTSCIVNAGAIIDHHCQLGEGSHVLIGAVVRNERTLAPLSWVSANAVVE